MSRTRTRTVQAILGTAVATAAVVIAPAPAHAGTITVACSEKALVAAVNLANATRSPDTLQLAAGCTYRLTSAHGGPSDGLPVITTSIEMIGPATITRSSSQDFRIATVGGRGALTLTTGVTFSNGMASGSGGGILNHGAVTLTQSSLTGNSAGGQGGGLANVGFAGGPAPAATFTGGFVNGNSAMGSGGGIFNGSGATLTTTGLSMSGNSTDTRGGAIAAISSAATTLTSTTITGNTAHLTAGGVYRRGGVMTTTATPITANRHNNCVGSAPAVPTCTR
ncbi:MAG: hypothetical protein ABI083_08590 [Lapillicoccus sp.]